MKGIILAAGVASRLRPLTDERPKCLLEVGGKALLERTLSNLLGEGVNDIIIVTGFKERMIRDFVTTRFPGLNVAYIHNSLFDTTNNIYSLWLARELLVNQSFMLLDSDLLFDGEIIKMLLDSSHENCIALTRHELGEEEIKVVVAPDNRITEISKTCSIEKACGESLGIEKFSPLLSVALFRELDQMILSEKQTGCFYEKAFERIIQKGAEIYPVDITHLFSMEIDTPEDFERAARSIPEPLL